MSDTNDLESLGMSLGKRLGRLEISGVEVVEQMVVLTDRCEVVEAAVLEEHDQREKDKKVTERVVDKLDALEKNFKANIEKHVKESGDVIKAKLFELKKDHTDLKEKFLSLVITCQEYEEKIKRLESSNDELMKAVKNLEKDKEELLDSWNSNRTTPSTTSPAKTSSSITASLFSRPPPPIGSSMPRQPPPPIGSIPLSRARAPHVMQPVLFHPQYMQVYAPVPRHYMQDPYTNPQGFTYPEWSRSDQSE